MSVTLPLQLLLVMAQTLSGGSVQGRGNLLHEVEKRLCKTQVQRLELSPYGGVSIKFMLRLSGGFTSIFKPEQSHYSARYEAEIAAYRLAALLGVNQVPAACERRIPLKSLQELAADPKQAALLARLGRELRPDAEGMVRGAAIDWIPHVRELPAAQRQDWAKWLSPGAPVPPLQRARLGEIADLLLLDLLFGNPDRFTGGNLLEARTTGRLLMIDNSADFRPVSALGRPYHLEQLAMLRRVRAVTYQRMRQLDRKSVIALVRRPAGQGSYLTYPEIRAFFARRDALVRHVEELRRAHGDEAVLLP